MASPRLLSAHQSGLDRFIEKNNIKSYKQLLYERERNMAFLLGMLFFCSSRTNYLKVKEITSTWSFLRPEQSKTFNHAKAAEYARKKPSRKKRSASRHQGHPAVKQGWLQVAGVFLQRFYATLRLQRLHKPLPAAGSVAKRYTLVTRAKPVAKPEVVEYDY